MQVSFNIRLFKSEQLDNGKYPIVLQVIWREGEKSKVRRKRLGISCHDSEWDRDNHRIQDGGWGSSKKNAKLQESLNKAEKIYREHFLNRKWDYREFAQYFSEGKKEVTLTDFCNQLIKDFHKRDKAGTAIYYDDVLKALQKYTGKEVIYFQEVDHSFLKGFENYYVERGFNGMRSMRGLKAIFGKAVEDRVIDMKLMPFKCGYNPIGYKFNHLKKVKSKKTKTNWIKRLSMSDMKKILSYQPTSYANEKAMDLWKFSYYTMGVNFKDIALLKMKDIRDGIWFYEREKTDTGGRGKPLLPECLEIIEKYYNSKNKYVFHDILRDCYDESDESIKCRTRDYLANLRRRYKKISEELELSGYFTFYSARYTSSTIAAHKNANMKAVQNLMDHASITTTDNYVKFVDLGKMRETLELLRV